MIENFLTTEQVAKILQVHPFTILKFLKSGKLRGVKLGRVYRIKESDVQAFLDGRMTGGHKSHGDTQATHQPTPLDTEPKSQFEKQSFTNQQDFQSRQFSDQHPQHPHSNTSAPYSLKQDKNEEDGPPHYII